MKIIFLSRLYYPHVGGVEKHVDLLTSILLRRHEIKIITEKFDSKLKDTEIINGVEVFRIPSGSKWETWRWMKNNQQLLDWADVIHAHDVYFWILPYKLFHPYKKTYITFHGWEGKYPVPAKNIFVRKLCELVAHGNICVGDYIRRWYYTNPTCVTYGAV